MESLQSLKRRLKGVQNINQITKAMELVAATKMRKSQEIALNSRPYALSALDFLANLSSLSDITLPPLLTKRPVRKKALVLVTSDKGLAGSFNASTIKAFEAYLKKENVVFTDPSLSLIAVGQKATGFVEKQGVHPVSSFVRVGDFTTINEVAPISSLLTGGYLDGRWDAVTVFSAHFKSALRQEVVTREILPVDANALRATARELVPETGKFAELIRENKVSFFNTAKDRKEYLIEPSPEAILTELAEHLVTMQVYHLVLEANASEHAARRVAMKNASDNARDLSNTLTLIYNKSRQASITREIIEITAGAEAR